MYQGRRRGFSVPGRIKVVVTMHDTGTRTGSKVLARNTATAHTVTNKLASRLATKYVERRLGES
jgi:hypothetical protein